MKLVKLIANLGYGSRKQVTLMFREGRITDAAGEVLYADDAVAHDQVRVDGEPLDPPQGLLLMLHKPTGLYSISSMPCGGSSGSPSTRRFSWSSGSSAYMTSPFASVMRPSRNIIATCLRLP